MVNSVGVGGSASPYIGFSNRHQIGDIQVLDKQGQPIILLQQISNPQNIKNLIQTEMKVIGK